MNTQKNNLLPILFLGLFFVLGVAVTNAQTDEEAKHALTEKQIKKMKTTGTGLKYHIEEQGKGIYPEPGDKVHVHYTGRLLDGRKFDSSHDRGQPLPFTLGARQVIQGWDEGIALLNEGGKAKLFIPSELAYGNRKVNEFIEPNTDLVFDVELVKVEKAPKPYDTTGVKPVVTASGLKYYKIKTTDGVQAKSGQKVMVHYSGYLQNGQKFDSSIDRGRPFEFDLGKGRVIKGWDEGVAYLKVGEKAKFIIPSNLGYGAQGAGNGLIPPNADLIFDVELLKIK